MTPDPTFERTARRRRWRLPSVLRASADVARACPGGGTAAIRSPLAGARSACEFGTSRHERSSVSGLGALGGARSGPKPLGGGGARGVRRLDRGAKQNGPATRCSRRPASAAQGQARQKRGSRLSARRQTGIVVALGRSFAGEPECPCTWSSSATAMAMPHPYIADSGNTVAWRRKASPMASRGHADPW